MNSSLGCVLGSMYGVILQNTDMMNALHDWQRREPDLVAGQVRLSAASEMMILADMGLGFTA